MPDRAVVHVAVEMEGATRESAYAGAGSLAKQVDDVIERRGNALGRVTTAALVVRPNEHWEKNRRVRTGWVAGRATVLEVTVLEVLGELVAELASAGASVSGLSWELDPANPVHGEARRLAAQDARQRALDYAGALGLEVGAVAWASEPGLRQPSSTDHRVFAAAAAAPALRGPGDEDIVGATPEEITAQAVVEVAFWLAGFGT